MFDINRKSARKFLSFVKTQRKMFESAKPAKW